MEILKIKALADEWNAAAWKVIEFENPGFQALRKLFEETLELAEEYNKRGSDTNNVGILFCFILKAR